MGWYGSPPLSQIRTPAQYARASAPGRLAAREDARGDEPERQDQQRHRDDPPPVAQARNLATERPAMDVEAASRRAADPSARLARVAPSPLIRGILPRPRPLSCRGERRHRHHHRRGGGQGPGPGDPQPVRDARGRPGRDDRGHLDRELPRGGGRRALPGDLLGAGRGPRSAAARRDEAAGERRDCGPRGPRRDRRLPDRWQPAPPVVDDRRDAPGRRDAGTVPARGGRRRARPLARRRCRRT